MSTNFEDLLSRAHGNVKEQNKVLSPPQISINYCIIIIIIIIIIINSYCINRIISNLIRTHFTVSEGYKVRCGLESRSRAGFWKHDRAAVRGVRTIQ